MMRFAVIASLVFLAVVYWITSNRDDGGFEQESDSVVNSSQVEASKKRDSDAPSDPVSSSAEVQDKQGKERQRILDQANEDQRKADQAQRASDEKQRKADEARLAEEQRALEEQKRIAEAKRKAEEERRRQEEAARKAEEERKRKEEEERLRKIAAEKRRLMASYVGKLVTVPAGKFQMGGASDEANGSEKPVHTVTLPSFKIMDSEMTFFSWDACVEAKACTHNPVHNVGGRDKQPVVNVSYEDIVGQYIPWLNKATGKRFRLPSEAEWEYAARAGSSTKYSWGNELDCKRVRFNRDDCKAPGSDPVKSYGANAWGLYNMHGNVWEMTADCWNPNYNKAPKDGSARTKGDCESRSLRGGSWFYTEGSLRSASRFKVSGSVRYPNAGFRLVLDI
jgi:formylglycine-generating enzyme required for sulfatase activity